MRNKLLIIGVVFLGLFLGACQAPQSGTETANSNTKAPADPKVVEEVQEMLTKHDKALNDQDLDAVMATFSVDPKTVLLGTGAGERFVGPEEIKAAYTEIFKGYDKGSLKTDCEWKTGGVGPSGEAGWLALTCKYEDALKDEKREYVMNVSGAVVKKDGNWGFLMLHLSNSTDPGPPADATKKE